MAVLVLHSNVLFEDQVVYLDGNAYISCEFKRCTMIHKGGPMQLGGPDDSGRCTIDGCVWNFEITIHDPDQLDAFVGFLNKIKESLPKLPGENPPNQQKSAENVPE